VAAHGQRARRQQTSRRRLAREHGATAKVSLLSQHHDSPATQFAAQDAGRLAIGYGSDMSVSSPKASLTAAVWNWTEYYKYTMKPSCPGARWIVGGEAIQPSCGKYWIGSFKEGTVELAPLNVSALASHRRKFEIGALYDERPQWFVENVVGSPKP
jgi:hypothetical protein